MKRGAVLVSLFISIILILPLVIAADETTTDTTTTSDATSEQSKISQAYDCLKKRIDDKKCSALNLEEKIFSLLAVGKCQTELVNEKSSEDCWPKSGCDIKSTALAGLALSKTSYNTQGIEEWLGSQNTTPTDVVWYLQIISDTATTCDITYDGIANSISINEDSQISSSAGSCLSLSEGGGYWLMVSPSCYNQEFDVKCSTGFKTNLIYKKRTSPTVYVSEITHQESAMGTTTEKINSFCFAQGSVCDYEGSLWAALFLKSTQNSVSSYLPYLVTMADENTEYIPESFLWGLTSYPDFRNELLNKQKSNEYWDESGDKFYDTALALLNIDDEPSAKKNAKQWLLSVQDKRGETAGCWGGIRNTGFILASVWPDSSESIIIDGEEDCEDAGNDCMLESSCDEVSGNILSDYACAGISDICCDKPMQEKACTADLGGEICNSNEFCPEDTGTEDSSATDLSRGEVCCVDASCEQKQTPEYDCEDSTERECKASCSTDEDSTTIYICEGNDICCEKKAGGDGGGIKWWVWVLIILIVLVIIGIIFRDKLRIFWFRLKSGGKGRPSGPPSGRPGMYPFPTTPSGRIPQAMPMQRRIFPPAQTSQPRTAPRVQKKSEIDEVLKKLKEMGR